MKHAESYDVLENYTFDLSNAEGESFEESEGALFESGHGVFANEGMASSGVVKTEQQDQIDNLLVELKEMMGHH